MSRRLNYPVMHQQSHWAMKQQSITSSESAGVAVRGCGWAAPQTLLTVLCSVASDSRSFRLLYFSKYHILRCDRWPSSRSCHLTMTAAVNMMITLLFNSGSALI